MHVRKQKVHGSRGYIWEGVGAWAFDFPDYSYILIKAFAARIYLCATCVL